MPTRLEDLVPMNTPEWEAWEREQWEEMQRRILADLLEESDE